MKISLVYFLFFCQRVSGFVSRSSQGRCNEPLHAFVTKQEFAKASGAFLLATSLVTSPVNALDAQVYNHEYADPLHPFCQRKIEVATDGKTFHYSGTAVGPKDDTVLRGCSRPEVEQFGLRQGAFDGQILDNGRISAGDGIHEGIWEPKTKTTTTSSKYEDADGIRWNDGNKWIVKSQSLVRKESGGKNVVTVKGLGTIVGEYIFLAYIGFSTLAGVKGLYDGIQRRKEQAAS